MESKNPRLLQPCLGILSGDYNIMPKVRKSLFDMGIRNFKLQGRDFTPEPYQREVIIKAYVNIR
jgi:hypothetical protein